MISIEFTPEILDSLYNYIMTCPDERARKKCLVLYLKGMGLSHKEIAAIARVDQDTVTNYLKQYAQNGLEELLEDNYRKPTSQLEPHKQKLKKLFEEQPPHTVNHANDLIFDTTGIRLKHSGCRDLLKKMGLKFRRTGLVPGKALDDKKQQEAQQDFHDNKLQPILEEAKAGERTVLFIDAAHFVMGAFLGMVWCFKRVLLPSSCGRMRYNALGAFNPITHEVITETNETYINQVVFSKFLEKIATSYQGTERPITLVLDNARYQKCKSVFAKAEELGIELLYLPAYSPNLNLIERLWRFVKKEVLYSRYYQTFISFKESIDTCLNELTTRFKDDMISLMTLKFQLFS